MGDAAGDGGRMTVAGVAAATGGRLLAGDGGLAVGAVAVDSRAVAAGGLFVAVPGERVDGHDFVAQALAAGARAALVRADRARDALAALAAAGPGAAPAAGAAVIAVPDTVRALGDLAAWHRRRFCPLVVGVTGSAGKTTTKDMLAAAAARRFTVLKTPGNYNTDIGLPLCLLDLDRRHEVAVVEMAMRGPGEIARLAEIARPRGAVITNIGLAHVERLGSPAGVARAKGELLLALPRDGFAVLNGDDEWCRRLGEGWGGRQVYFGFGPNSTVGARELATDRRGGQSFTLETPGGEARVELPLPGRHNAANALAAAAAALALGVPLPDIAAALAGFTPAAMRTAVRAAGGVMIIDDTYNANPASAVAALDALRDVAGGGRAVAVLGEMRELGEWTAAAYREVAAAARERGVDLLVAVGEAAPAIAGAAREAGMAAAAVVECGRDEAGAVVSGAVRPGDTVLVKGSRLARMEDVVADLVRRLGGDGQ